MNLLLFSFLLVELIMGSFSEDCKLEKPIGDWMANPKAPNESHGIMNSSGVNALDEYHVVAKKFMYDGKGQDVHFWVGETAEPTADGSPALVIGEPDGNLREYNGEDVAIELPATMGLTAIKYIAVYDTVRGDLGPQAFAYVEVEGVVPPAPPDLGPFMNVSKGVQGTVSIVDARTIDIMDFSYDGAAPNASFVVGTGHPGENGTMVMIEEGTNFELTEAMDAVRARLKLGKNHTVCECDWLAVYDPDAKAMYGHVMITPEAKKDVVPDYGQTPAEIMPVTTETPMSTDSEGPRPPEPAPTRAPYRPYPEFPKGKSAGATASSLGAILVATAAYCTSLPIYYPVCPSTQ